MLMEKKFTWGLEEFSSLRDEKRYSQTFRLAGCNWRLLAYPNGDSEFGYLSVYLDLVPGSLPAGWRSDVEFSITLVNNGWGRSNKVLEGQCCFDAKDNSWGFKEFLSLFKLREGFLVNDRLIIIAQVHVLPAIVVPEEPVKFIAPLGTKEGNQACDASVNKSQGDSSCQVEHKSENASRENLNDDDGTFEEGSDVNDASEESTDDNDKSEEGSDASKERSDDNDASEKDSDDDDKSEEGLDDENASEEDSDEDDGTSEEVSDEDDGASEEVSDEDDGTSEEVSDEDDGTSEEVSDEDDASSPVSDDGGRDKSLLNQSIPLKDGSLTVGNRGMRCNNVASEIEISNVDSDTGCNIMATVTEASSNLVNEIQPVNETMDANGFQVFSSEVESVRQIFKRHPDIALAFRPKNEQIRRGYMNALLSLIKTLCQAPEKLSEDDLSKAEETLDDLIDVGCELDWLKTKLNEVSEKKKMEQGSVIRIQTMEEQLQKLKLMFLDLETQLHKEKLAARAPLSFNDVVC